MTSLEVFERYAKFLRMYHRAQERNRVHITWLIAQEISRVEAPTEAW